MAVKADRKKRQEGRGGKGPRARSTQLAAFCAASALAPAAAHATSFVESSVGDFGNTFATRYELPLGTDVVSGQSFYDEELGFDYDYFSFTDLVPGTAFSLDLEVVYTDESILFTAYDEAGNVLIPNQDVEFGTLTVGGTVPASGEVTVRAIAAQDAGIYGVTIDAAHVPEPSTGVLTGLALAGLSFLRRRGVRLG